MPASQPGAAVFPLVFVHIPKCAGRSLEAALYARYPEAPRFTFNGPADFKRFAELTQDERDSYDLIVGHAEYGIHEQLRRKPTYITLLREPVDRVISRYHYFLRNNPNHPFARRGASLIECLDILPSDEQVRHLCSDRMDDIPRHAVTAAHLEEASHNLEHEIESFGLVERYDESLARMAAHFGWERVRFLHLNPAPSRPAVDEIDAETRAAIVEHNRLDLELYDFAEQLFARQSV